MTTAQIDYLWELATREGEERDLYALFPDIDWGAAQARRDAAWAERRAQQAQTPAGRISLAEINEVQREVFGAGVVERVFADSPLLGKLKR